jgi:hypothetical protein
MHSKCRAKAGADWSSGTHNDAGSRKVKFWLLWSIGLGLLIDHLSTFGVAGWGIFGLDVQTDFPTSQEKICLALLSAATVFADLYAAYAYYRIAPPNSTTAKSTGRVVFGIQIALMLSIVLFSFLSIGTEKSFFNQYSQSFRGDAAMALGYVIIYWILALSTRRSGRMKCSPGRTQS